MYVKVRRLVEWLKSTFGFWESTWDLRRLKFEVLASSMRNVSTSQSQFPLISSMEKVRAYKYISVQISFFTLYTCIYVLHSSIYLCRTVQCIGLDWIPLGDPVSRSFLVGEISSNSILFTILLQYTQYLQCVMYTMHITQTEHTNTTGV